MKNVVQSGSTQDHGEELQKRLISTAKEWKWRFNLPEKPNYDNVYYYKKSKKIFNAPCYDLDTDKPPENYKGEFLQVKNILHQSEFRLRRAQEEAKKKKLELAKEWKELEAKENELRNNFIQFNKFLGRNNAKRTRAEQKFQEMSNMKQKCVQKMIDMREESEKITEFVEKLKKRIVAYQKYERYLTSVVMTGSFKNIQHVVNRYVILEETKQTVGQQMNETSEEFHNRRVIYVKMLEESELAFLSLCNQLSDMRRKYDDAKHSTSAWEVVIQDICNKYAAAAQNISWSRMALRHIFDMALYRIRRRRKWLVKTKSDDLSKMLRVNETLKALERIESQLRKLQGQKNVGTSMDPGREGFEIREKPGTARLSTVMSLWKEKKDKHYKEGLKMGDLAGYLKKAMERERRNEICRIKLDQDKWKRANVRNFEERYRQALLAIREEKLSGKLLEPKQSDTGDKTSVTSVSTSRSHKTRWAAAAVAQKIIKEVAVDTFIPTPTASASFIVSATSETALTVHEDGDDTSREFISTAERLKMKKIIERKFNRLLDSASPRDLHDVDKEKPSMTLPSILTGYQLKEKDFSKRKTPPLPGAYTSGMKKRSFITETDKGLKSLAPTEKLPRITTKIR